MYVLRSLLELQSESLDSPEAAMALKDASGRIRSMGALYDRLYLAVSEGRLSLPNYLPSLVDEIVALFPWSSRVAVVKKIDDFTLDFRRLQVLGIVVNELLTNSMKYAFEGKDSGTITVSVSSVGGRALVSVEDDGMGIPDSFDFGTSDGLGMTIVRELAGQLEGTISIERAEGKEGKGGTRVLLDFPV